MIEDITYKVCYKCGEEKPLADFYKNKNCKDGYRNVCKTCCKEKQNQYRNDNRDIVLEKKKKYYYDNRDIILEKKKTEYYESEYNKTENLVKIVRRGFPGKNREILLIYSLSNIRSIGIKITEGLNPTRSIYLCLKDERQIPLTPVQEPTSISDLEEEAADLAKFLDLKLENL